MGPAVDFELILPFAMREFIPVGLFGLLIAALLAAFMSTYAATVNAAPAYVVNDIYKRYINPNADDKTYVRMSYLTSVVVVIAGTAFGFVIDDLKDVVNWIVGALYGGYVAANLLKWHWWRFNGWGYFWGMTGGIGSAMAIATVVKTYPQIGGFETNLALFPVTLVISLVGCIAGSLLTAPDDPEVLQHFYLKVRPWGWWGPVREQLLVTHPDLAANKDFSRDAVNVAVGIAWQTALTAAGIYLVLQNWTALGWCVAVIVITSALLKFNWYDKLHDYPDGYAPEGAV
jgi:Na+/proline symporter